MTRQTYLAAIKAEKSGPLFIRLRRNMKTTTIIKRSGLQKTVCTGLFPKFVQWITTAINIFVNSQHFPLHHSNSWEFSNPCCPS